MTDNKTWTASHVPGEAYDRMREQLHRAEDLLRQIRDGKHSLPGTLVQIDRYFEERGKPADTERSRIPGAAGE